MMASKPKKKSKVDPLQTETELNELGAPPSTSDLGDLFEADTEGTDRAGSSDAAFTEETGLDDSRANSGAQKDGEDTSSRSSTPSSNTSRLKRLKRNAVTPIHEETSFGVENKTYELDAKKTNNVPEAWSDSGSDVGSRPGTAPAFESPREKLEIPRPGTAPQDSPRLIGRGNKVTPVSSRSSTPVEKFHKEIEVPKVEYIAQLDDTMENNEELVQPVTSDSIKSTESRKMSRKEKLSLARKNSWTIKEEDEHEEKTDAPEKSLVLKDDTKSISSIDTEAVLAPPASSGDQEAYIPVAQAKACIQRVIEDMKKMKANHYKVVEKVQDQYQLIEEESQAQFNAYVIKLRGEYNTKAATFRQVLESHQTEFTNKQRFYEEAIKSLRDKNRSLLIEKRQLLLKAKDSNASHEEEKNNIVTDLTGMLDEKHKNYVLLHGKYVEEKKEKEEVKKEVTEMKSELADLKSRLELTSGESQKIFEDFDAMKKENENLKLKINELEEEKMTVTEEKGKLEEEKGTLEEQCNEKNTSLQDRDQQLEMKAKTIEELELKIKELEEREPVVVAAAPVEEETVTTTSEEVQQSSQLVPVAGVSNEELEELKRKVKEHEEDKEKTLQEVKENRDEKNIVKMELINVQERNRILHRRLETMLNEVSDSVNIDTIQSKLAELQERRAVLQSETDDINKKIEEWKESYRDEHDSLEPSDDDYPDDTKALYEQLKMSNEKISSIDKDIVVLSMLLDGTLPDDMKQEDNAERPLESVSDQLKQQFTEEKDKLNEEIKTLESKNEKLKEKIEELEVREPEKIVETVATTVPVVACEEGGEDSAAAVAELTNALAEADTRIQELETEHAAELDSQKKHAHKTDKRLAKLQAAYDKLEIEKRELESQLKVAKESAEAELKLKEESLEQAKKEIDEFNEAKIAKLPVKAKTEIKALQEKLKQAETRKDGSNQEVLDLKSQIATFTEDIANLNITIKALKEKEEELVKLQETDKKYKELKKKYKALEAKKTVTKTTPRPASGGADPKELKKLQDRIDDLEKQLEEGGGAAPTTTVTKKDSKIDSKAVSKLEKSNEVLKEKVEALKKTAQTDADKIKDLQEKLKEAKAKGDDKAGKKQEKAMKDLQKKFESEQKKTAKLKEDLEKAKQEIADLQKEVDGLNADAKKDKDEISKLSIAAKEGIEAAEKVSELSRSNKELTEENKTLAENFNSERILRKKYYNMVEDMKGKIRVYARARPLSRSELERGNHNIVTSPDEYSVIIQTARGPKDFQYDAVFTPDLSQEKVFEDTNNLIQSAVDGYNVCIFAYGQTGSGKTYTMIGDKEQKSPGIAPRAFKAIYALIDENKTKFSFTTQMYMMELYRDNLIDLFGNKKDPAKLDIKKDKKGMVVVSGAVIKDAINAEELMRIFEEGSASRHVASTKMNSESSRSHLILSIIIESTNLTSGAVVKGKLSLVDLAGSERAAKTGATPEQLKEAQSINKSLSALGDVISALSSEQSFIPYRNNKLTMVMQDSLGGNAKTLMFVNISPADYNADETITSLTYASRVKLITNDASKNADNKEISRLKGIISKLKKGETIDDDDV